MGTEYPGYIYGETNNTRLTAGDGRGIWVVGQDQQITNGPESLELPWPNPWERIYETVGIPEDLRHPYYEFDFMLDKFKEHGVKRVLDVASGPGRHACEMARQGFEVSAFDISRKALSLARESLDQEGLKCGLKQQNMFARYKYPDDFFDGTVAIQAIYHGMKANMENAIREIWRVTRTGGLFGLTVSLDRDRSVYGAVKRQEPFENRLSLFQEIAPGTFVPNDGREKGLPHFYPDRAELMGMLTPNFEILYAFDDNVALYRMLICRKSVPNGEQLN